MMRHRDLLLWTALLLVPITCFGQGEKVLKGSEVNEPALIEALTPEARPSDGKPLTRSIRITPQRDMPEANTKRPSASMLVTFETNSAELTPQARKLLDTLGRALQSNQLAEFKFSIEGHADPRGGEQFNLLLSQQRAEKVVSYLAETQGIDRNRLKAVGKGQSELLNLANPDAPENRRVTVKTIVQ